jgi:diacylglycerol kinase
MSQKRSLTKSFGFAFAGVKAAFKNEPNFKIHVAIGLGALIAGFFLGLTRLEWLILAFTIFFVLITEMLNTVLEKIVDLASPEINEKARIAKDVSAAAVLFSAILALLVGAILFIPKL